MSFTIKNHLLFKDGKQVDFKKSPNAGRVITPSILVMHYTAASSEAGAISWLCNPQASASAHLVIGESGTVTQLVPFNIRAWHAGPSTWNGKKDINSYSIGIEMVNAGRLVKRGDGKWVEDNKSRKVVPDKGVILAAHKNGGGVTGWDDYPPAQFAVASDIARAIVAAYGISEKNLVGHEDICPGRKTDPGPAFGMETFKAVVFGRK